MDCLAPTRAEARASHATDAMGVRVAHDTAHAPVAHTEHRVLSFSAGGSDFAIDIRCVREIRTAEPATRVPGSPAALRGVIDLRGTIVPVVDLAAHVGAVSLPGLTAAVVVVEVGEGLIGLQVDGVDDVIELHTSALKPVPPLADTSLTAHLVALVTVGPRLLQWLDVASLLRDTARSGPVGP
jgi:purine-binding chemotaxis protein CheW